MSVLGSRFDFHNQIKTYSSQSRSLCDRGSKGPLAAGVCVSTRAQGYFELLHSISCNVVHFCALILYLLYIFTVSASRHSPVNHFFCHLSWKTSMETFDLSRPNFTCPDLLLHYSFFATCPTRQVKFCFACPDLI